MATKVPTAAGDRSDLKLLDGLVRNRRGPSTIIERARGCPTAHSGPTAPTHPQLKQRARSASLRAHPRDAQKIILHPRPRPKGLYDVSGDDNAVSAAKNISTAVERTTFAALGHQRAGRDRTLYRALC